MAPFHGVIGALGNKSKIRISVPVYVFSMDDIKLQLLNVSISFPVIRPCGVLCPPTSLLPFENEFRYNSTSLLITKRKEARDENRQTEGAGDI